MQSITFVMYIYLSMVPWFEIICLYHLCESGELKLPLTVIDLKVMMTELLTLTFFYISSR